MNRPTLLILLVAIVASGCLAPGTMYPHPPATTTSTWTALSSAIANVTARVDVLVFHNASNVHTLWLGLRGWNFTPPPTPSNASQAFIAQHQGSDYARIIEGTGIPLEVQIYPTREAAVTSDRNATLATTTFGVTYTYEHLQQQLAPGSSWARLAIGEPPTFALVELATGNVSIEADKGWTPLDLPHFTAHAPAQTILLEPRIPPRI